MYCETKRERSELEIKRSKSSAFETRKRIRLTFSEPQKLAKASPQGCFYSRITEEFTENSEIGGILTCPVSHVLPSFTVTLKTNTFETMVVMKTSSPAANRGSRMDFGTLQKPVPRELPVFDLSGIFLKNSILQSCLYLTDSSPCQKLCPEYICQKQSVVIV